MARYFLLILSVCCLRTSAQNAFYDAQYLASVTTNQRDLLAPYAGDTTRMTADIKTTYYSLSDEEVSTIQESYKFLTAADLFQTTIKTNLINTVLLKKIFGKLAPPSNLQSASIGDHFLSDLYNESPSGSSSQLGGLTTSLSRLSSTDYQTMLVDATATYIAESFKEDVVYTFFSKFQDKIHEIPEIPALLPKTCAQITKLNPFNFNDLGNSWKQDFESDIQNLPVNFRDFVKNGEATTWYGKLKNSKFFSAYSYSVDLIQPLIKGYHPIEVLEMVDKQYTGSVTDINNLDEYEGIIHFVNIVQTNLQDSSKKASAGTDANAWVTFNQLKQLNTAKKLYYFFALLYQQDQPFFDNNAQFGAKIKAKLFMKDNPIFRDVLANLSDFLILLNQVEGGIKDIQLAKSQKQTTSELISTYIKNVLDILGKTNGVLQKMKIDQELTNAITKYLNYANTGYTLYKDVAAKNYADLIQNSLALIDSLAGQNTTAITTNISLLLSAYNGILAANGRAALTQDAFVKLVLGFWNGSGILSDGLVAGVKVDIGYGAITDEATKSKVDDAISFFGSLVENLNVLMLQGADVQSMLASLLAPWNNVRGGIAEAALVQADLLNIVAGFVKKQQIDKKALAEYFGKDAKYKSLDNTQKPPVDALINQLYGAIDLVNVSLSNNSQAFNHFLEVMEVFAKYGKVIAMIATAQSSQDLENVIKTYVMPPGSYSVQRSSLNTVTVSAQVGAFAAGESGTDNLWTTIRPTVGLTAPIGFEWSWGRKTTSPTKYQYIDENGQTKYLKGTSHSLFLQVLDIIAPVNYRLTHDAGALPSQIKLQQLFSPGLSYNGGFKELPFDWGVGIQYTPSLRTIGSTPEANAIRLFVRLSWDKPLIPLYIQGQTKASGSTGY